MHLHFVQSLEPLQGAGLGQAALSLHLAMRGAHGEGHTADGIRSEALNSELHAPSSQHPASRSVLLATRATEFDRTWPDVIQGVRRGHTKMFYAPELKRLAAEAVEQAEWFHGHGLYVWTNMWLGGEARKRGKPLVYHPQGFFDPWILRRSQGKKRIAHWLFEDKNIANVRWWRAVSNKEAEQIRAVVGSRAVVHVIPNGVDLREVDALDTHEVDAAWSMERGGLSRRLDLLKLVTRHTFGRRGDLSPQTPVHVTALGPGGAGPSVCFSCHGFMPRRGSICWCRLGES